MRTNYPLFLCLENKHEDKYIVEQIKHFSKEVTYKDVFIITFTM